jgi:hypothetical protein
MRVCAFLPMIHKDGDDLVLRGMASPALVPLYIIYLPVVPVARFCHFCDGRGEFNHASKRPF